MEKDMTKEKVVITETVTRYPALGRKLSEKGRTNLSWQYMEGLEWVGNMELSAPDHAVVSSYLSANPGTARYSDDLSSSSHLAMYVHMYSRHSSDAPHSTQKWIMSLCNTPQLSFPLIYYIHLALFSRRSEYFKFLCVAHLATQYIIKQFSVPFCVCREWQINKTLLFPFMFGCVRRSEK